MAKRTKNPIKQWWKILTGSSSQVDHFYQCLDRRPANTKTTSATWDLYTYCEYEEDCNGEYIYYRELFDTGLKNPKGRLIEYCLYEV